MKKLLCFLNKQSHIITNITQKNIKGTELYYVLLLYCNLLKEKTKSAIVLYYNIHRLNNNLQYYKFVFI